MAQPLLAVRSCRLIGMHACNDDGKTRTASPSQGLGVKSHCATATALLLGLLCALDGEKRQVVRLLQTLSKTQEVIETFRDQRLRL